VAPSLPANAKSSSRVPSWRTAWPARSRPGEVLEGDLGNEPLERARSGPG
jgi:hypothetical protein